MDKKTEDGRRKTEVRYVGAGAFWPGIPARDLTAEEWAALSEETRAAVVAAGIYEVETASLLP